MMLRRIAALAAACAAMSGCTRPSHAKDLLAKQGYTQVEITGYDWFGCSEDDWFQTGFRGVSPSGEPITGTVCKGLIGRGATIRFD